MSHETFEFRLFIINNNLENHYSLIILKRIQLEYVINVTKQYFVNLFYDLKA